MAYARCILWHHAGSVPEADPNALLDAADLAAILAQQSDHEMQASAKQWATLWGRTFKSLTRHLRGEPKRALQLFAEEVYPFLRGDRLAARLQEGNPMVLWLHDDLPSPYVAAMVEEFLRVTGNNATVESRGNGRFDVQLQNRPSDIIPMAMRRLAQLRIPLVFAAFLGAAVGIANEWNRTGLLIIMAAMSLQVGANALHDLLQPRKRHQLGTPLIGKSLLLATAITGHVVAMAIGLWFAWQYPLLWAIGAIGLGASILYRFIQDHGLGPLVAGIIYGPVLAVGAHLAATGDVSYHFALLGTPIGALAAAWLYLGDLADRPLDEAGGHRTLLVRLPAQRHVTGFALLVAIATVSLYFVSVTASAIMAVAGAAMVANVHQNRDDPKNLSPTRVAILVMQAAIALTLMEFQ